MHPYLIFSSFSSSRNLFRRILTTRWLGVVHSNSRHESRKHFLFSSVLHLDVLYSPLYQMTTLEWRLGFFFCLILSGSSYNSFPQAILFQIASVTMILSLSAGTCFPSISIAGNRIWSNVLYSFFGFRITLIRPWRRRRAGTGVMVWDIECDFYV